MKKKRVDFIKFKLTSLHAAKYKFEKATRN